MYMQPNYPTGNGMARMTNPPQDVKMRKLFVGGLPWGITEQQVHTFFSQFGVIEDFCIVREQDTGMSKGYGFVLFQDLEATKTVLRQKKFLYIERKWVDCKHAYGMDILNIV